MPRKLGGGHWKTGLNVTKSVEVFEYRKNNERYWSGVELHRQWFDKALQITEIIYLGSLLQFPFNNATSHFFKAENIFWKKYINKRIAEKQVQLHDGWYYRDDV